MHTAKVFDQSVIKIFYLILLALAPLTSFGSWVLGREEFRLIPQVVYILTEITMFYWLVKVRFIVRDWLVTYLICYTGFLLLYGITVNPLSKATVAHLVAMFLPIVGTSMGFYFAKYQLSIFKFSSKEIIISGSILSLLIMLYYFFYLLGSIPYFGVSTLIAIPFLYAITYSKYKWAILLFIFSLLTGKRVVVVAELCVLLLTFISSSKLGIKRILSLWGAAFCLIVFLIILNHIGLENISILRRFNLQSTYGQVDINQFSSGRLDDVFSAINSINELPEVFWLIGRGMGVKYTAGFQGGEPWIVHYSHFSPVSYILLGGLFLLIPIYARLLSLSWFAVKNINAFHSKVILYYFISSFSGAILFSDPFVWILLGTNLYFFKLGKTALHGNLRGATI